MNETDAFDVWQAARDALHGRAELSGPWTAEQLRFLLSFSVLAPTAHNTVPQKYAIDVRNQAVHFFLDEGLVLPASDAGATQALMSVGCALESLRVAAAHHGHTLVWDPAQARLQERGQVRARPREPHRTRGCAHETPAEASNLREVGVARVVPAPQREASLLGALCERRMIRQEYDPSVELPDVLLSTLSEAVREIDPRLQLRAFRAPQERFAWGKLDELAMKFKLEELEFRRELGAWLRDDSDRVSVRGMRGREFGLQPEASSALRAQLLGEQALAVDQTAFMARMGKLALASASAVLAIVHQPGSEGLEAELAVKAGQAYQRCALLTWQAGFANAVHTGVVQVAHARSMCRATLLSGAAPLVVFRVGKPRDEAHWHRPVASRPSLDSLLVPLAAVRGTQLGAA